MKATEIRMGRNFIRSGDTVRVKSSAPHKRDGFTATFRHAELDDTGGVRWVEVFGGPRDRRMVRSIRPERIERVAQTRGGERVR